MTADRPTTEPRTEAPMERLHREFGYLLDIYGARNDESGHWANCRDIIEAEAAQGAAPRAEGLDVERLAEAFCYHFHAGEPEQGRKCALYAMHLDTAVRVANEYDARRPSDEPTVATCTPSSSARSND